MDVRQRRPSYDYKSSFWPPTGIMIMNQNYNYNICLGITNMAISLVPGLQIWPYLLSQDYYINMAISVIQGLQISVVPGRCPGTIDTMTIANPIVQFLEKHELAYSISSRDAVCYYRLYMYIYIYIFIKMQN